MTCHEFREIVVDLVRGDLDDSLRGAAALQHVRACAPCAATLDRQRSLQVALQFLAIETAVDAPPHVGRALREVVRSRRRRTRRGWWYSGAAAAAAVACVLATELRPKAPLASTPRVNVAAPIAMPSSRFAAAARSDDAPPDVERPRPRPRRASRLSANRPDEQTTSVAEFVPFGYGGDLGRFDDTGQIIRVELPVATLISLGMVIGGPVRRTVQADVWLGHDGMARAVRVVPMSAVQE